MHEQGLLTQEAKQVYEALLKEGPLDSVALRKAARLASRESETRFNRALEALQTDFKILPVGVAKAGAWKYAFIYDLVAHHYPGLPEQARPITHRAARRKLAELYFCSLGAAPLKDMAKLFGWKGAEVEKAIAELVEAGIVERNLSLAGQPGEWVAITKLV